MLTKSGTNSGIRRNDATHPDHTAALPRFVRWLAFGAAAFGIALAVGTWCADLADAQRAAPLTVEAEFLDFGEAWAQDTEFRWELPITNNGKEPISVLRFETSCGCTSINPQTLSIEPGDIETVSLTLDLTHQLDDDGEKARVFGVDIRPILASRSTAPVVWRVEGNVSDAFTMVPALIDFGNRLVHGQANVPRSVSVKYQEPLESLIVEWDRRFGTIVAKLSNDDKRRFTITAELNPELPVGSFDYRVAIRANTANGQSLPPLPLRVLGKVRQAVVVIPEVLHFGIVDKGEPVVLPVTLSSLDESPFSVKSVSAGLNVTVKPVRGSEHSFEVVVDSRVAGERSPFVDFITVDKKGCESRIRVPIRGYVTDGPEVHPLPNRVSMVSLE